MGLLNPFTKPAEPIDAPPPLGGSARTPPDPCIRRHRRGPHACAIAGGAMLARSAIDAAPRVCAIGREGRAHRIRCRYGPAHATSLGAALTGSTADLTRHREPCLPLPVHHARRVTLSHWVCGPPLPGTWPPHHRALHRRSLHCRTRGPAVDA